MRPGRSGEIGHTRRTQNPVPFGECGFESHLRHCFAELHPRDDSSVFGATPLDEGLVEFRVWAPRAETVSVLGQELAPEDDGVFAGRVEARAGDDYRYRLDGDTEWPDPCSRFQPEGVRGPSRIVDTRAFDIRPGPGITLQELVIYELHVGTFTPEGTFDAVIPRPEALSNPGITAVELMPVATFPGNRGWGY